MRAFLLLALGTAAEAKESAAASAAEASSNQAKAFSMMGMENMKRLDKLDFKALSTSLSQSNDDLRNMMATLEKRPRGLEASFIQESDHAAEKSKTAARNKKIHLLSPPDLQLEGLGSLNRPDESSLLEENIKKAIKTHLTKRIASFLASKAKKNAATKASHGKSSQATATQTKAEIPKDFDAIHKLNDDAPLALPEKPGQSFSQEKEDPAIDAEASETLRQEAAQEQEAAKTEEKILSAESIAAVEAPDVPTLPKYGNDPSVTSNPVKHDAEQSVLDAFAFLPIGAFVLLQ